MFEAALGVSRETSKFAVIVTVAVAPGPVT
jgi:hypothetical protein